MSELATMTPASFPLDVKPMPTATVKAGHTKNCNLSMQPIRQDFAEQLRPWLAERERDAKLWPGVWNKRAAEMIRRDL